jgi:hypothetical protein
MTASAPLAAIRECISTAVAVRVRAHYRLGPFSLGERSPRDVEGPPCIRFRNTGTPRLVSLVRAEYFEIGPMNGRRARESSSSAEGVGCPISRRRRGRGPMSNEVAIAAHLHVRTCRSSCAMPLLVCTTACVL